MTKKKTIRKPRPAKTASASTPSPASSHTSSNSAAPTPPTVQAANSGNRAGNASRFQRQNSGISPTSTASSMLSANAAAWYPQAQRASPPSSSAQAPMKSVFGVSSSRFVAGTPVQSTSNSVSVGGSGPQFPASPMTPPSIPRDSSLGDIYASGPATPQQVVNQPEKHRASTCSVDDEEDVVLEFIPISDRVAADEDQLIGAMIGGGYWGDPDDRSRTPGSSGDDWVGPDDEYYDNRTPPEYHLTSHAHQRSMEDRGATPVSFIGDAASTAFDDDLYDSELDWIEDQLAQHQAHDDPTLFF